MNDNDSTDRIEQLEAKLNEVFNRINDGLIPEVPVNTVTHKRFKEAMDDLQQYLNEQVASHKDLSERISKLESKSKFTFLRFFR